MLKRNRLQIFLYSSYLYFTGNIISINNKVNISVVTAIFDLDRDNWDKVPAAVHAPNPTFFVRPLTGEGSYFTSFDIMTRLKNDITVITEEKLRPIFEKYQQQFPHIKVIYRDIYKIFEKELNTIAEIQALETFKHNQTFPGNPQVWNPKYILVNFLKSWFILEALKENNLKENIAWLDFGYFKDNNNINRGMSFEWDYEFSEKIHYFSEMEIALPLIPLESIVKSNQVFIAGRCFIAPKKLANKCWELIQQSFNILVNNNLIDQDQTMMFLAWQNNPEFFEVHEHFKHKFYITQYSKNKPKIN